MQTVVKQLVNEDQELVPVEEQVWHGTVHESGDVGLICTGEYIYDGCGHGEYITKLVKRGGITCPDCIHKIKAYKSIRL